LRKIGIAAPVVSENHIRLLRIALDIGTESALWERLWERYGHKHADYAHLIPELRGLRRMRKLIGPRAMSRF
jgi:hypothetical protein